MKPDRLPLYMVFMMKLLESMEMPTHGNIALKSSITLELEPLLKVKSSVSMEDFLQRLEQLIKLE